jgi:hypothetical protein
LTNGRHFVEKPASPIRLRQNLTNEQHINHERQSMNNPADFTLATILACKSEARKDKARLSFAEKIAIVERMRQDLAPFNARREKRQQAKRDAVNAFA